MKDVPLPDRLLSIETQKLGVFKFLGKTIGRERRWNEIASWEDEYCYYVRWTAKRWLNEIDLKDIKEKLLSSKCRECEILFTEEEVNDYMNGQINIFRFKYNFPIHQRCYHQKDK